VKATTTCGSSKARVAVAMLALGGLTEAERQLEAKLCKLEKKRDSEGVLRLEAGALALVNKLREGNPAAAGCILNVLGLCHYRTGDFARACELHEEHRAIWEALGDSAQAGKACGNLGICYFSLGQYARARELHEQEMALTEASEDPEGFAGACGNLGICYHGMGDHVRARELHEQRRAICESLGDRAGVAGAYGNLGVSYYSTGDYARAREMHEQHMAMSKALGNRAAVAMASGNLANCHARVGDYRRACELHHKDREICEALGDRAAVAGACGNLGNSYLNLGDYAAAISYYKKEYTMAEQMQVQNELAGAAMGIGVALRLGGRLNVTECAAGAADELPGACAAEKWLQTALALGYPIARLHLARLAFDLGEEQKALAHLQGYLSTCVEQGPNWCNGCGQTRGKDAPMLTCAGCRVARFCSAEHQKMASRGASSGGCLVLGRHKDACGLLGMWRQQVVKDGAAPEALRAELLAFLRR
jgi:tetratricopeptide (TPR) repeat protein